MMRYRMDENELNEILELLEAAGMSPMRCDTGLPLYSGYAHCGTPTEPGEGKEEEMVMFPRALLGE